IIGAALITLRILPDFFQTAVFSRLQQVIESIDWWKRRLRMTIELLHWHEVLLKSSFALLSTFGLLRIFGLLEPH
ncbi:MAG: hypothetical protein ACQPRI_06510, partial [Solitalea-like symbiont of Tyrophagus putrescentiae]